MAAEALRTLPPDERMLRLRLLVFPITGLPNDREEQAALSEAASLSREIADPRAAAIGVLNGERYAIGGVPVFDTSRLALSATIGAGVGLP